MKEYTENDKKVREYSFEDWEQGIIAGNITPGTSAIRYVNTGELYYEYLPYEEYEKIEIRRKEIYWQKVENQFQYLKNKFEQLYQQSGNKERLLITEKEKYEKLLFSEKLPLHGFLTNMSYPIEGINLHSIDINSTRELYQKLIVKGEKEFFYTNSPNCKVSIGPGDYYHVRVEAIAKYYDWLNEFKDTRYWVNTNFFKHWEYTNFKDSIVENGFYLINYENQLLNVYSPELALIFTSTDIPTKNLDTKEDDILNGVFFLKFYALGFQKGTEYFTTEFSIDSRYGVNAEQLIKDIHHNYFHAEHKPLHEGWIFWKKHYPNPLTKKAIEEFGFYAGIISKVEAMVKRHPSLFKTFEKCEHQTEANSAEEPNTSENSEIEIKPIFKLEYIETIYDILKDFFNTQHQQNLKELLTTGNSTGKHLFFLDNGNRLADAFRQLKESDIITGCDKENLKTWIKENFCFLKDNKPAPYKLNVLDKYISENAAPCKSPLIKIENGKIIKVDKPRKKKYNKY